MSDAVENLSRFDVAADLASAINRAGVGGTVTYTAEPALNSVAVTAQAENGTVRRFELEVRELPPPGRIDPVGPVVDRMMQQRPPDERDFEQVPDALNRIGRALGLALDYQHYRGQGLTAAQKDGVIDAIARALLGDEYDTFVDLARDGFSGWQSGILPVPPDQAGDDESRAQRARLLKAMQISSVTDVPVIAWDLNSVAPGTDVALAFTACDARDAATCLLQKADDVDSHEYANRQES